MGTRRTTFHMGVLLASAVLVLGFVSTDAAAQVKKLDHFKCYLADAPMSPVRVQLEDQFDRAMGIIEDGDVLDARMFCNPVRKRHGRRTTGIRNRNAHLEFHWITSQGPGWKRRVKVANQFNKKAYLTLGLPLWLGVPSQKEGHDFPQGLDHYKCYEVLDGPSANASVELEDQWGTTRADLGIPIMFCNPAKKTHDDEVFPIRNRRAHLTCYEIRNHPGAPVPDVLVTNQFASRRVRLIQEEVLCVPSRKGRKYTEDPLE